MGISGHVIVFVHVDDGPIGLGEASDRISTDLPAIVRQYNELLIGRDPPVSVKSTNCCAQPKSKTLGELSIDGGTGGRILRTVAAPEADRIVTTNHPQL